MDQAREVAVGMADLKTGREGEVLSTVLGSCVGVCLYAPRQKIGGLLHLMMPASGVNGTAPDCKKGKYADTGIPELVRAIKIAHGVPPSDLIAKIFGGAKVLQGVERNIGAENVVAVQAILKEYGLPIKAYKVGGEKGYRIKFAMDTGRVVCQVFGQSIEEF
jgi:chemotaxis protein CheD